MQSYLNPAAPAQNSYGWGDALAKLDFTLTDLSSNQSVDIHSSVSLDARIWSDRINVGASAEDDLKYYRLGNYYYRVFTELVGGYSASHASWAVSGDL
jgi:hypothetical protein